MDCLNIKEQVKLYFNTLHEKDQKGGHYVFSPQDKYGDVQHGAVGTSINKITNMLYNDSNSSVFVTLNSYNKVSDKNLRNRSNLWGLDCIMIDIDGKKELCGKEQELYDSLSWFWKTKNLIPEPNLWSCTGGGGIHLYYCFERLPRQMENSIKTLKKLFNQKIDEIQKSYDCFPYVYNSNGEFITYKVDTKVTDSQRYDRIPGSINKKTGRRCVCFRNNIPRYKYSDLFEYFECDSLPKRNAIKKKKTNKTYNKTFSNEVLIRLAKKRIKALFELQKNGHSFINCREYAVFIMANSMRQLNFTTNVIEKTLNTFNQKFYEPLRQSEIEANVKQEKVYAISNNDVISWLNLDEQEKELFLSKKRPGNRKKKTFKNKVNIAKLVIEGFSISEIAKKLSISISIVKHMRVAIKKSGGFSFWSTGCNKKAYKKALMKKLNNKKKPVNNRLFSAAKIWNEKCTIIGSFCNKYNIFRRNIITAIQKRENNSIKKEQELPVIYSGILNQLIN